MNQYIFNAMALLVLAFRIEAVCKGYPNRATGKTRYFKCNNLDINFLDTFPNDTTSIYLENVKLERITNATFSRFPNLQYLSCKSCGIKSIANGAFSQTPKLRYLGLEGNELREVDGNWFGDTVALEELSIPDNYVSDIFNNFFEKATKLKLLNVDYTNIDCLNLDAISGLKDLIRIDIKNNILKEACHKNLEEYANKQKIQLMIDSLTTQKICKFMRFLCVRI